MTIIKADIETNDGVVDTQFFKPSGDGPYPAVILYMDALGIRPALFDMCERFVTHGYAVLLPNLFYRVQPGGPVDRADRDKMMALVHSLTNAGIISDTEAFIAFLDSQPGVDSTKIGCVGYCMGGAFALSAAGAFPERVLAAASFHGGRLATEAPDSPHLLAPKMRGEIYAGVAESDDYAKPDETARLKRALDDAGVKNTVEVYAGTKHGWAIADHPVYDKDGAEKHWQNVLGLFERNL